MKKSQGKRRIKPMLMSIGVIVLIVITVFGSRLGYLSAATKGPSIMPTPPSKSALLVIDVQNDTLSIPQYKKVDKLINNINRVVEHANKNNMEVIYVQQEYGRNPIDSLLSGGKYKQASEGSRLSDRLHIVSNHVFKKHRSDTFSVTAFDQFLGESNIDTLYLVGADATACIYKTALGGVNRGYRVNIVEDALFSINQKTLQKMLQKYQSHGIEVVGTGSLSQK